MGPRRGEKCRDSSPLTLVIAIKGRSLMRRRLLYLAVLSMVATLIFAPAALAQNQTVTVSMEDNVFAPANITVEPGTTVTWVQNGDNPHTTTSYDGLWDSGLIQPGGGSFSYTFDEPGTYEYYCIPHEDLGMVGSVTVTEEEDADEEDAAPLPTVPEGEEPVQRMPGEDRPTLDQYAPQYAPEEPTPVESLPDSGGPGAAALLLPAAGLLLATGLVGLRVLRHRS